MAYSDQKFYSRVLVPAGPSASSFGTFTASGSNALTNLMARMVKFKRRCQITAIRINPSTIINAASTAAILSFLNGTSTFGTAVITTNTVGTIIDGAITSAANAVLAADTQPSISISGTATASGAAVGAYDVYFEVQELNS